jgi:putative transposase
MEVKRGWYSRGYLPHFDVPNLVQFITFRLADSIPSAAIKRIEDAISLLPPEKREAEKRIRLNKWLDKGYGRCWLALPEVARCVEDELLSTDGDECMLLGWCVMPNHVHVLAEVSDDVPLSKLVKTWKGASAAKANKLLGRKGTFWFREYWDRYIRDARHLHDVVRYIDRNPVKAGLAEKPEDWLYGSARLGGDFQASTPNEFGDPGGWGLAPT